MARPKKEGCQYFNKDCDYDDEMETMGRLYQNDGLMMMDRIYQNAFKRNDGEMPFNTEALRKGFAAKCYVSLEKLLEMLETAFDLSGLLDREAYENRGVLTSRGIKKRISAITSERDRKKEGYRRNNAGETPEKLGSNVGDTAEVLRNNTAEIPERAGETPETFPFPFPFNNKEKGKEFQTPANRYQLSAQAHVGVEKQLKLKFGDIERARGCIRFYEKHASDWLANKVSTRPPNFDQLVSRMIREDEAEKKNFFHPNNKPETSRKNLPERKIVNGS